MQKSRELIFDFSKVYEIPWGGSENATLEEFQCEPFDFTLPKKDHVHLWLVDLEIFSYKKFYPILSKDEKGKLEKIIPTTERELRSKSRIFLRLLLSLYVKVKPESIIFNYGEFGKPEINTSIQKIFFNVSHSEYYLSVLIDSENSIGIDIETKYKTADISIKLAKRFFSQEEFRDLKVLKGHEQEFLFNQLWTLKEAVLKSNGKGIHLINKAPNFSNMRRIPKSGVLNYFQKENYSGFTVFIEGLWLSTARFLESI